MGVIRLARVADAIGVHAVLFDARKSIPLTDEFGSEEYVAEVRRWCKARDVWVCEADGSIVGILCFFGGEVRYIAVVAEMRGSQIGGALIERAKADAESKGWEGLTARTKPTNAPAIAVLRRAGFEFQDTETTGDPNGWDHYRWSRTLTPRELARVSRRGG